MRKILIAIYIIIGTLSLSHAGNICENNLQKYMLNLGEASPEEDAARKACGAESTKCQFNSISNYFSCDLCPAAQWCDAEGNTGNCTQTEYSKEGVGLCSALPDNSVGANIDGEQQEKGPYAGYLCKAGFTLNPNIKNYTEGSTEYKTNACVSCADNHYKFSVGNDACDACKAHSVHNSDRTSCTCAPGWTTNSHIITEPDGRQCTTSCDIGYYKDSRGANDCAMCPGYKNDQYPNKTINGITTNHASTSISQCMCPAGYGGNAAVQDGTCTQCAPGTYKASDGNNECQTCAENRFNPDSGATGCVLCEYTTSDDHTRCYETCTLENAKIDNAVEVSGEIEYDKNDKPITKCTATQCEYGYELRDNGSKCGECENGMPSTGKNCIECTANSRPSDNRRTCLCIEGYYFSNGACTACPDGQWRDWDGTSNDNGCTPCPDNHHCSEGKKVPCPNGSASKGGSKCAYTGGALTDTNATKFCDTAGNCFTLPTGVTVSYVPAALVMPDTTQQEDVNKAPPQKNE